MALSGSPPFLYHRVLASLTYGASVPNNEVMGRLYFGFWIENPQVGILVDQLKERLARRLLQAVYAQNVVIARFVEIFEDEIGITFDHRIKWASGSLTKSNSPDCKAAIAV
ncbi:hypothetical protein ABIB75_008000 [Bradyrhizobium sp. GM2.2]